MNELLLRLSGGTLISDGDADDVAGDVLLHPAMFSSLWQGLQETDDVIRGRTTHALEKLSRVHPDWFVDHMNILITYAEKDPVAMVRWHLTMLLTNLAIHGNYIDQVIDILMFLLNDSSVFVTTWAVSGLTILGRKYPQHPAKILEQIKPLRNYQGTALRSQAGKAVDLLENPYLKIPKSWIKT